MKLSCIRDVENQQTVYKLSMTDSEVTQVFLGNFDKLLIDECETSDKIADKVLALEMITRKIESTQQGGDK